MANVAAKDLTSITFAKECHTRQALGNVFHDHPSALQDENIPWPFHTWGLDPIGAYSASFKNF
ncbi:hypothetical protein COLO4_04987 [Corchorus olitorius]|uniref:Uncharacterized protein n=1 Tax=Corchorus olitorius TaxID=93759 RepID=A0A1R3KS95_9ROSI|nr:hypothetical protein COLO4_04987 [Corchorus olitorius]